MRRNGQPSHGLRLVAAGVIIIAALIGGLFARQVEQGNDLREDRAAARAAAARAADQAQQARDDLANAQAAQMELAAGIDALRSQIINELGGTPNLGPVQIVEVGAAPTAAQIRDAVDAYFDENPPVEGSPTPAELRAIVVQWLEANPPEDGTDGTDGELGATGAIGPPGPAPTLEQLVEAVAVFCADGRCQGPAGPAGPTGPGPTDEQVNLAVAAYCANNNGCVGPPGPAPVSWTFTIANRIYTCVDPDADLNYTCPSERDTP